MNQDELKKRLALNKGRLGENFVRERLRGILGTAFIEDALSADVQSDPDFTLIRDLCPESEEDDCVWFKWRLYNDRKGRAVMENIWPDAEAAALSNFLDHWIRILHKPDILTLLETDWRKNDGHFSGLLKTKVELIVRHWQALVAWSPSLRCFDPKVKSGFDLSRHEDHYGARIEVKWSLRIWGTTWIQTVKDMDGVKGELNLSEARYKSRIFGRVKHQIKDSFE